SSTTKIENARCRSPARCASCFPAAPTARLLSSTRINCSSELAAARREFRFVMATSLAFRWAASQYSSLQGGELRGLGLEPFDALVGREPRPRMGAGADLFELVAGGDREHPLAALDRRHSGRDLDRAAEQACGEVA